MGYSVVRTLPEDEWRTFVTEHPTGNIFHTPEMFQVFSRAQGYHPELWAVRGDNDRVLALMLPVKITLWGGLLRRFTTRAIVYGGVLCCADSAGHEALNLLLSAYKKEVKNQTLFTEFRNLSNLNDIQPILQRNHYIFEDHLDYQIDVSLPTEEIWNKIDASARKKLKKALKKNLLAIEEVNDISQIPFCYNLFHATYDRVHVPLPTQSLFETAFEILYPKGMIQFLLGRVENTYVAASAALLYKDVIYGWYRGFNRTFVAYFPNDLMVWRVLKWGSEHGYHIFDFGGAGKPDEKYGPRAFKAKFGGNLVDYGRNTYVHSPYLFHVSQFGYQLARRFLYPDKIQNRETKP
jgi:lipid II:glycine glycyltransferase (peptidoglycan interpeptide bridge formation enzyme)